MPILFLILGAIVALLGETVIALGWFSTDLNPGQGLIGVLLCVAGGAIFGVAVVAL